LIPTCLLHHRAVDFAVFHRSCLLTCISGTSTCFSLLFDLSHISIAPDVVQPPPVVFPSTYAPCDRNTYRFRFYSLYFVFYSHFDRFAYHLFVSLLYRRVTRVQSSRTSTVTFQHQLQCDRIDFEFHISISVLYLYSRVPLCIRHIFASFRPFTSHHSRPACRAHRPSHSGVDPVAFRAILTFLH